MSDAYTKLFASITESTVWREPAGTRLVWITMLAKCNRRGEVYGSVPGLADLAKVSIEECVTALSTLLSPDPWSRTRDHEGRRIAEIDGGWCLLNHAKFDRLRSEIEAEERDRERKREWDRQHRPSGHARSKDSDQSDDSPTQSDTGPTKSVPPPAPAVTPEARARGRATSKAFAPSDARTPPAVVTLPLNDGSEFPITADQVREFADLYPAVDVPQSLRAMRGWCVTNPTNRKTRAGILRFVNRWLAKEQDSARPAPGGSHANSSNSGKLSAAERVARVNADAERHRSNVVEGEFDRVERSAR